MSYHRRHFLKTIVGSGLLLGTGAFPMEALAAEKFVKLTILHTNDVHSRVEPFANGRNAGLGGAAKRAALIQKVRQAEKNVLLLDSGDIFQGTPYFNFFGGDVDFKLMNSMGYDAATIGNHDFDAGLEVLKKQAKTAKFPLLSANYDFSKTVMDGFVLPHHIIQKGKLKIGIFGLGIDGEGLVAPTLYAQTRYLDPVTKANETAAFLKEKEKCHFVICLSHLGYKYDKDDISDLTLAPQTAHIDLILGGHTHTFLDEPTVLKNAVGEEVMINQAGWAGILLGRIDIYFRRDLKKKQAGGKAIEVR